jgi:hypothetical protein
MIGTAFLTKVGSIPRSQLNSTYPGMAHFAGTGPLGATCAACHYFQSDRSKPHKPQRCATFIELMIGRKGKLPTCKVPPNAMACKYFCANETETEL